MLDEIARLQREQISADDLKGTIQHYLTRYYLGQETNAAQAGELAQAELLGGGWRNATIFMERISAVTTADVQRVAQKYMRNIRFVVLGRSEERRHERCLPGTTAAAARKGSSRQEAGAGGRR